MNKGFDCATPLSTKTAALFASQGFTFVGRYLAEEGSWKRLSPAEAQFISNSGLHIVSFFEKGASRAREGAAAGTKDGKLALQLAKVVGQPVGSSIYAAVDYDASSVDLNAIEAYMRAFDAEIIGYELGVYGSYSIVKEMFERGVAKKLMQTYAWSRGKKFNPISLYQYQNDTTVNGISIDLNESNGDAGGWRVGVAIQQRAELDRGVANTIIQTWIKPDWDKAEVNKKTASKETIAVLIEQQRYYNWLAIQLRKASGQFEE
ncbi:glycoside hydrolase domain-containing protein [Paenibacillus sp. N3.4]|uniref:glycoside hydrolase domain-containing protein n=1 Tax=Paenibacillus sp. N3.4 TaxID=2603222 RepID=UPI0011C8CA94|nr:glycoside hydrolase domain-containing protein [Paenibacillus sp. N3.4]TXK82618.1 DUF1906 domain-containing protein [Paenibacillus sp. N3.4]